MIRVRTKVKLGRAVLSIANSVPKEPSRPGNGMALKNVRERLRLMHDVAAQFETRQDSRRVPGPDRGAAVSAGRPHECRRMPVADAVTAARARRRRRGARAAAPARAWSANAASRAPPSSARRRTRRRRWSGWRRASCDLLLLDVQMPGRDGTQLAAELRLRVAGAGGRLRHRARRARAQGVRPRGGRLPDQAGQARAPAGGAAPRRPAPRRAAGARQPARRAEEEARCIVVSDRGRDHPRAGRRRAVPEGRAEVRDLAHRRRTPTCSTIRSPSSRSGSATASCASTATRWSRGARCARSSAARSPARTPTTALEGWAVLHRAGRRVARGVAAPGRGGARGAGRGRALVRWIAAGRQRLRSSRGAAVRQSAHGRLARRLPSLDARGGRVAIVVLVRLARSSSSGSAPRERRRRPSPACGASRRTARPGDVRRPRSRRAPRRRGGSTRGGDGRSRSAAARLARAAGRGGGRSARAARRRAERRRSRPTPDRLRAAIAAPMPSADAGDRRSSMSRRADAAHAATRRVERWPGSRSDARSARLRAGVQRLPQAGDGRQLRAAQRARNGRGSIPQRRAVAARARPRRASRGDARPVDDALFHVARAAPRRSPARPRRLGADRRRAPQTAGRSLGRAHGSRCARRDPPRRSPTCWRARRPHARACGARATPTRSTRDLRRRSPRARPSARRRLTGRASVRVARPGAGSTGPQTRMACGAAANEALRRRSQLRDESPAAADCSAARQRLGATRPGCVGEWPARRAWSAAALHRTSGERDCDSPAERRAEAARLAREPRRRAGRRHGSAADARPLSRCCAAPPPGR